MAMHQYIGARYVPYYYENSVDPTSTEWENNVNYEPLTVVTLPNLHSYISKKYVPASVGSPASNPEYWLDRGYDNAYIQALQNEVDQIQQDLGTLDSRVDDIEADKRRIVCVTDSYGTHSQTNWAARVFSTLGLSASDSYLFAEGSSGFSHVGQSGHTFQTLLSSNFATITDPNTVTDVIFGGGTNDFYYFVDKATLITAISDAIAYVKANFPKARIWIAFMGYWSRMLPAMRSDYYNTIALYQSMAYTYGARFINAYAPMHSYFYRSDNMHPNEYGNQAIAEIVLAAVIGGDQPMPLTCDMYGANQFNANITAPSDVTQTSGTLQLNMLIKNDDAIIHLNTMGFVRSLDFNSSQNVIIGDYPTDNIPIISANDYVQVVPMSVIANGVNSIEFGRISFIDSGTSGIGRIIMRPLRSLTGVTFYQFIETSLVVPLICA